MDYRKILGREGEEKASSFLIKKGYCILERNYRKRTGEVDIVCEKDGMIVFVEVKRRSSDFYGQPHEAVDKRKKGQIVRCAQKWLYERNLLGNCDVRFDVVSISRKDNSDMIYHIEDAFRP